MKYQPGRKHYSKPEDWAVNKAKTKREAGKEYKSLKTGNLQRARRVSKHYCTS